MLRQPRFDVIRQLLRLREQQKQAWAARRRDRVALLNVAMGNRVAVAHLVIGGMPIGEQHVMMRLVSLNVLDIHLPGMILRIEGHRHRMPVGERTHNFNAVQIMIVRMGRTVAEYF